MRERERERIKSPIKPIRTWEKPIGRVVKKEKEHIHQSFLPLRIAYSHNYPAFIKIFDPRWKAL